MYERDVVLLGLGRCVVGVVDSDSSDGVKYWRVSTPGEEEGFLRSLFYTLREGPSFKEGTEWGTLFTSFGTR